MSKCNIRPEFECQNRISNVKMSYIRPEHVSFNRNMYMFNALLVGTLDATMAVIPNKLASFKKGIQYVGCNIFQSL